MTAAKRFGLYSAFLAYRAIFLSSRLQPRLTVLTIKRVERGGADRAEITVELAASGSRLRWAPMAEGWRVLGQRMGCMKRADWGGTEPALESELRSFSFDECGGVSLGRSLVSGGGNDGGGRDGGGMSREPGMAGLGVIPNGENWESILLEMFLTFFFHKLVKKIK
ncbi:hypothetical protein BpHYR1_011532 [Brachionus plicatilis]|uniref:Uncharacterized protein n=1 Tax=Brachionus plicatilis TaxID=10195 RepID=A0A3M7QZ59_BRAPC|nr:hypothetical protein BpHYR1_011532 [Brachionus plicatilis]